MVSGGWAARPCVSPEGQGCLGLIGQLAPLGDKTTGCQFFCESDHAHFDRDDES